MRQNARRTYLILLVIALVAPVGTLVYALTNTGSSAPPVFRGHVINPDRLGPRVLYAPSEGDDPSWRDELAAQIGGTCDYFDARFETPSPELLSGYDCVMTWTNYAYADNVLFGNNLADFVDAGGHVVLGAFCACTSGNYLAGRIMDDTARYCPVTGGFNHFEMSFWDGSDPDACVHPGITSYGVTYRDFLTLVSGSVAGLFEDGEIANAINAQGDVVYANGAGGYPLSPMGQDAARAGNACPCGPYVAPTGACCLANGSCLVMTRSECGQQGGIFQGSGVACDPDPCPAAGACCFGNGTCQVLASYACEVQGGNWQGPETPCDPNPCPQPGACCLLNGSCWVAFESDCSASGGVWQGPGTSCDPHPCPLPTGACCFANTSCAVLERDACVAEGGSYQGDGSACAPNPCLDTGACCYAEGGCTALTEISCVESGGAWQGVNTTCDPNPCPQPGACCYPAGYCTVTTAAECGYGGGTWQGGGTSCTPSPCPPAGACCYASGSCTIRIETACASAGGTWQGAGTTCSPSPCPHPLGACFFLDCSCHELTQPDCIAQGGQWLGAGTTCDGDRAPADPAGAGATGMSGAVTAVNPGTPNVPVPTDPSFEGNHIAAGGRGPRILYAPSEGDDACYRALMAGQVGGSCDYFDARYGTPSAAFLDSYDCVMTWANYAYFDNVGFGNNLADFVDHGGHVVLGAFTAYTSGNFLSGRIMTTARYCPVTGGTNHFIMSFWDGSCPGGCLHVGVTGYGSTYRDYLTLVGPGATICGRFQDGEIANAINSSQDVIYANGAGGYPLAPAGQDAARAANGCTCGFPTPVERTTWGSLKSLFR